MIVEITDSNEKQQMIKGLFFDFDGVITMEKQGSPTIISYISKETKIPYEMVNNAYCKHNHDLLYGKITHKDIWKQFCEDIGCSLDYQMLESAYLLIIQRPI